MQIFTIFLVMSLFPLAAFSDESDFLPRPLIFETQLKTVKDNLLSPSMAAVILEFLGFMDRSRGCGKFLYHFF